MNGSMVVERGQDIVLACMKDRGVSQSELAEALGEDRRKLHQQLHKADDMKCRRLAEILSVLGYRLEVSEIE